MRRHKVHLVCGKERGLMMYQRDVASQQEETAANEPIRGLNITEVSFDTPAMQGTM